MKKLLLLLPVIALLALSCSKTTPAQNPPVDQNSAQTQPTNQTPPQQNQPTPPQDETADWKTYNNAKFNFSFQYPKDWKIEELNQSPFMVRLDTNLSDPNVQSYFEVNPVNVARESVFDRGINPSCPITTIVFAGKQAKECKTSGTGHSSHYIKIVDLKNIGWEQDNEVNYEIRGDNKALLNTYEKILPTFKFTK